jgi:hypothetical protein
MIYFIVRAKYKFLLSIIKVTTVILKFLLLLQIHVHVSIETRYRSIEEYHSSQLASFLSKSTSSSSPALSVRTLSSAMTFMLWRLQWPSCYDVFNDLHVVTSAMTFIFWRLQWHSCYDVGSNYNSQVPILVWNNTWKVHLSSSSTSKAGKSPYDLYCVSQSSTLY